jgi:hypothetical protein
LGKSESSAIESDQILKMWVLAKLTWELLLKQDFIKKYAVGPRRRFRRLKVGHIKYLCLSGTGGSHL